MDERNKIISDEETRKLILGNGCRIGWKKGVQLANEEGIPTVGYKTRAQEQKDWRKYSANNFTSKLIFSFDPLLRPSSHTWTPDLRQVDGRNFNNNFVMFLVLYWPLHTG